MSDKYTRRGQSLMASIGRIQDSVQLVNDTSIGDLRGQVDTIKRTMTSIRNDFEREVKRLAKTSKNQNIVGYFGGVRKVKVADMDAEIVKMRGNKRESLDEMVQRFTTLSSRFK